MNCKPGDLAIVTGSRDAEDIGIICSVIELVEAGKLATLPDGSFWHAGIVCWHVKSETRGFIYKNGTAKHALIRDRHIRPVSGLPDTEDTDTEQPIKEVA